MSARHPWTGRAVIVDGDPYTLDRVEGAYAHLSTPTALRAVDLRTTTLALAEAPPAAPTSPAPPTDLPALTTLAATIAARLGAAASIELPAIELAALQLGRAAKDHEVRAMLEHTNTTRESRTATIDTPDGVFLIERSYKGNRVWLTISRKK